MANYVISDTHFSHLNILSYEPIRLKLVCTYANKHGLSELSPERLIFEFYELYKDKEANKDTLLRYVKWHNDMLVEKWNNTVGKDDTVYFLGDFTLTNGLDKIIDFTYMLNGNKVLIMGNHDQRKLADYMLAGWKYVIPYSYAEDKRKALEYIPGVHLMHCPPAKEEAKANPNQIYIFGHVHGTHCDADDMPNCRCACVERLGGIPADLDKLIEDIKNTVAGNV